MEIPRPILRDVTKETTIAKDDLGTVMGQSTGQGPKDLGHDRQDYKED